MKKIVNNAHNEIPDGERIVYGHTPSGKSYIQFKGFYLNGKQQGFSEMYDYNGKLLYRCLERDGKTICLEDYYPNGKLEVRTCYSIKEPYINYDPHDFWENPVTYQEINHPNNAVQVTIYFI